MKSMKVVLPAILIFVSANSFASNFVNENYEFAAKESASEEANSFCSSISFRSGINGVWQYGQRVTPALDFDDNGFQYAAVCGGVGDDGIHGCYAIATESAEYVEKSPMDPDVKVTTKVTSNDQIFKSEIKTRAALVNLGWYVTGGEKQAVELKFDNLGLKEVNISYAAHKGIVLSPGTPGKLKIECVRKN